jgi:anti-sigma B factor antagonist
MPSDRCVLLRQRDSVVAGLRETAGVTEVRLSGEIDLATRSSLVDELSRLVGEGGHVIQVDLAAVTFLDAGGVGAFLGLQRNARACGCDLLFTNPRGIVARVIEVLGPSLVVVDGRG